MASRASFLAAGQPSISEDRMFDVDQIGTMVRHSDGSGMKILRGGAGELVCVWITDDAFAQAGEELWWEKIYPTPK